MILDQRSLVLKLFDHLQGGRFADIVDIGFIGRTQDETTRTFQDLSGIVHRFQNAADHVAWHIGIDLGGQLDKAGIEVVGFHLPG